MTSTREAPGLIADIGGTNVRFALITGHGEPENTRVLKCRDFDGPFGAAESYLGALGGHGRPDRAAFAVASPVAGDTVTMTNHPWSFSIAETRERLGLEALRVVNDFAAVAMAVPYFTDLDRTPVGGGEAAPNEPIAVLGPGTGLGVSALVPAGGDWIPLSTEGGHVTMAAANAREEGVIARLRRTIGHVSAERVISGPGLVNIYQSLCALDGKPPEPNLTPDEVSARAFAAASPRASEALEMFCAMLGTVASNLALSLGARGGVYIAGGIVPKLGRAFAESGFRERFEDKGRFSDFVAAIPTFVVTRELPAFVGLSLLVRAR
ncbi:MAG: glucokinase [Rhodospirillales bacterium]|jgi:glucokinase|nr:glucokinase [Rhodospirillales bacterium]